MEYYAKTNTGSPETGFITAGEYLTKKQAEALGEEKLRDMVKRGVLGVTGESPRRPEPPAEKDAQEPDTEPEAAAEDADEPEEAEEPEETEEAEDDLPALDAGDVIADEPPAKPASKRGGRKAK